MSCVPRGTAIDSHSDRNTFVSNKPLVTVLNTQATRGPGLQAQLLLPWMWQLCHLLPELEKGWKVSGLLSAQKEDVVAHPVL